MAEGQGFLLTRHWQDTDAGVEVDFWLATDAGPRRVRVAPQPAIAFIPDGIAADLRAFVEAVEADKTFDPKALKLSPPDAGQLVARLKAVYNL